jgi:hypothetical protein
LTSPESVPLIAGIDTGDVGAASGAAGAGVGDAGGGVVACAQAGALLTCSNATVRAAAQITVFFM